MVIACEQAHLVCNLREYLGGGNRRVKPREEWGEALPRSILLAASLADFRRQDTRANYTLSEPARRLLWSAHHNLP